ncbi:cytochrome d ubiquinol oxidase subunit II [Cryobacterium sp. BB307]|uniref:cytochrome d ubiquinol oxidase subunit II n=1 Tax=Cryobacterium sp. BB307 TaxID=2716317 RepID=UPI00144558E6|nr:cytochrome d ubiquinol oxidase subunit II [Cryobacterium sp. BB307]
MDFLPTLWFVLIAFLWIGYLLLDGFDLGVGMHMLVSTRSEKERRLLLNTIGPVWDGNEVWLITAGAATFAAFPVWYATLFSGLYLPLVIVLLALIVRAVSIEYRGKAATERGRRVWHVLLGAGSFGAAFGIGAMLAITTTGLPIDENAIRVGGAFAWFSLESVIGGLAVVGFCFVHGATFLALKTDGDIRYRMRRIIRLSAPVALLPIVVWVLIVVADGSSLTAYGLVGVAASGAVIGWIANRAGREGWAFTGFSVLLTAGASAIFLAAYPVVLPSSIDAAYDLTIQNASSSDYTLGVMTVVAAIGIPVLLVYQGWSYWVFRKRLTAAAIPDAQPVVPAVKRP